MIAHFLLFMQDHWHALADKLLQHIVLAFSATACAIVIGVPAGMTIHRFPKLKALVLGIANIFQTIPSLALLALLIPLLGIGIKPTIVALTIYAILPIVRNTYTAIHNVPADTLMAANGLGFTRWQRLSKVELPLAFPVILAGIRTATTMTIGITTIAAFIGAGGLGDFITQGLALDDTGLILLGAIPAALLALIVDYCLGQTDIMLNKRRRDRTRFKKIKITTATACGVLFFAGIGNAIVSTHSINRHNTVIVGSKNFTEQLILGNMIADLIQSTTKLHVIRKLNLGSTTLLQAAMQKGAVDVYPEYTGTAYMAVLHKKKILSAEKTYQVVKKEYQKQFQLTWLQPFGFNNAQTLAVTDAFAEKHSVNTLSDLTPLAPSLALAAPAAFLKRPDALPGLSKAYGLRFKKIMQTEPDLMYRAIANNAADVIEVFTTDARIQVYHLHALKDNLHFYPPYDAAPVIRSVLLKKHPELKKVLLRLASSINNTTMRQLNYRVNVLKQTPTSVAESFLTQKKLIHINDTGNSHVHHK